MQIKRARAAIRLSMVAGALAAALLTGRQASAAPFLPGNIVVTRAIGGTVAPNEASVGAPGSALLNGSGVGAAVYIEEYNASGPTSYPSGTVVQMPYNSTMVSGANRKLVLSGTQTTEGAIALSGDGNYLVLAGYDAPAYVSSAGSPSTNGSQATVINRVVGVVSLSGVVNTSTALTDTAGAQAFRSAYSSDGNIIYVNGTNGTNPTFGIRQTTLGSTTSTQIQATSAGGHRALNNKLGAGLYIGNTGTPAGNRGVNALPGFGVMSQLPGFGVGTEQTDDFWFADDITIYTADSRTDGNGGVHKWKFEDTNADTTPDTWVLKYGVTLGTQFGPVQLGNNVGAHGLTGTVDGSGVATIYATTFDGNGQNQNKLVTLSDLVAGTGNNAADQAAAALTLTTIAVSATNSAFRGVEFIPEPTSMAAVMGLAGLAMARRRNRA